MLFFLSVGTLMAGLETLEQGQSQSGLRKTRKCQKSLTLPVQQETDGHRTEGLACTHHVAIPV